MGQPWDFLQRIHIDPNTECWIWQGVPNSTGYGPHRRVYELMVGPIAEGLDLDHRCRIRLCLNPEHLHPMTRSENLSIGLMAHQPKGGPALVNALITHCKRGHAFTPENTYLSPDNRRICRECQRIRGRSPEYRAYQRRYQRLRRQH